MMMMKYSYYLFAHRSLQLLLSLVCTQLDGFKYCYSLFPHGEIVSSIAVRWLQTFKWFKVLLFIVYKQ